MSTVYEVKSNGVTIEFTPHFDAALEAYKASGTPEYAKDIFSLDTSNGIKTRINLNNPMPEVKK